MYGDVFSNRGKDSVHVSPGSGSGPSPLLTRLLLQNPSDDEGDGSGAGSRAGSVALDPSDLAARSGSPGIVSDDERGGWPLGASARAPRTLAAEALSLDVTVRPSLSRTASGLFRDQPLVGARPRARLPSTRGPKSPSSFTHPRPLPPSSPHSARDPGTSASASGGAGASRIPPGGLPSATSSAASASPSEASPAVSASSSMPLHSSCDGR